MSSRNHLQVVGVVELLRNVLSESVAGSSRVHAPPGTVIGVAPEQIAHWAFMRHFLEPLQSSNVIEGFDAGGEPSMEAEELILNHSGEW